MERAIDGFCRFLELVIAVALAAMVVLVFGNVVLRYGFNSGITVSEEVSRWLFIWSTFLGALVALREHGHLGVDMVVNKLPPIGRKTCFVLGYTVMLAVLGMLFKGSLEQTKINWDVAAPTTGLSMAIVHSSGMVFAAVGSVILLADLYKFFTGKLRTDQLAMSQESEEAVQMRQILGGRADSSAHPRKQP